MIHTLDESRAPETVHGVELAWAWCDRRILPSQCRPLAEDPTCPICADRRRAEVAFRVAERLAIANR